MPRPRKAIRSQRGKGRCGTPGCHNRKALGHFLCAIHVEEVNRIVYGDEEESDPTSRFLRRDKFEKKRLGSKLPTCCEMGCFEPRIPPNSYCDRHRELEGAFAE